MSTTLTATMRSLLLQETRRQGAEACAHAVSHMVSGVVCVQSMPATRFPKRYSRAKRRRLRVRALRQRARMQRSAHLHFMASAKWAAVAAATGRLIDELAPLGGTPSGIGPEACDSDHPRDAGAFSENRNEAGG